MAKTLNTSNSKIEKPSAQYITQNGKRFEVVDGVTYSDELQNKGATMTIAKKSGNVLVRKAKEGESIPVYSQGGVLEASETGHEGSYILTKAGQDGAAIVDEHGHTNSWQVSEETLRKKYDVSDDITDGRMYEPKGGLQTFVQTDKDVALMVPWGENGALVPQCIETGGHMNITSRNDIYGISKRDFEDTYRTVDSFSFLTDERISERIREAREQAAQPNKTNVQRPSDWSSYDRRSMSSYDNRPSVDGSNIGVSNYDRRSMTNDDSRPSLAASDYDRVPRIYESDYFAFAEKMKQANAMIKELEAVQNSHLVGKPHKVTGKDGASMTVYEQGSTVGEAIQNSKRMEAELNAYMDGLAQDSPDKDVNGVDFQ